MEVYKPTAEELQAFQDVTIPASMAFIENEYKDEGQKLAQEYLDAIKKAKEDLGL